MAKGEWPYFILLVYNILTLESPYATLVRDITVEGNKYKYYDLKNLGKQYGKSSMKPVTL